MTAKDKSSMVDTSVKASTRSTEHLLIFMNSTYPLTELMNIYSEEVVRLLKDWQVSEIVREASQFLPWMTQAVARASLKDNLPDTHWALLAAWHDLFQLSVIPDVGESFSGDMRSLKLRRLMRQSYLDISLVILTVADHAARMHACLPETFATSFWEDTKTIFLPLLHMLGLWELRRDWVEKSAEKLNLSDYASIKARLENKLTEQQECVDQFQTEINKWAGRTNLFSCKLRQPAPGRVIYRSLQGESQDELCNMIIVTLFAPTRADCYRVVELLHRLGTPVQGRFVDYIADPHANGYSAIHTVVIGNNFSPQCHHKMITFRIVTSDMHAINMWGIIKGRFQSQGQYSHFQSWWQGGELNRKQLALLDRHDIGDPLQDAEDHIYVFTPQGAIKFLNKRSAALDFAYSLHTQIGHHCRSVYVNGQKVSHATELQNGDLVLLKHDPLFRGPDPAWLHIATSHETRIKIKQGLRAIRQALHPGRLHFAKYLETLRKDSGFLVPEPQLEKYFMRATEDLGLSDVDSLFNVIVPSNNPRKGDVTAEKLLSFILESELATAILDNKGHPLLSHSMQLPTITQPILRFCPNCKPAPGCPIILHRKKENNHARLTLHRKPIASPEQEASEPPKKNLFGLRPAHKVVCLRNIDPNELDEGVQWGEIDLGRQASNITVVAQDRSALIGDLLQPIYNNDRVALTHIQATSDAEMMADILLVVESDTADQVENLRAEMKAVKGVLDAKAWPVSPSQSAHYKTRFNYQAEIPYTPGRVKELRMLYGRDNEIRQIRSWLERPLPERLLIIHGQRRCGKTSLAQLANKYLREPIHVVYVDLQQESRKPTSPSVYQLIIGEIHRTITKTASSHVPEAQYALPTPDALATNPHREFFSYLRRIQSLISPHRLLIILDEFNVLVAKSLDESFFTELRSITLNDFEGISLMLVTHTDQYETLPSGHPAHAVYEQGLPLAVSNLDQIAAKRLVKEPMRTMLAYNEKVANQIVSSTAGHPYLINLLCRDIAEHVLWKVGRPNVRDEDLRIAEQSLIRNGINNFNFAIEKIEEGAKSLIAQLAILQQSGERWIDISDLAHKAAISTDDAQAIVQHLGQSGVVSLHVDATSGAVKTRITIDYFCQWICRYWG